MSSSNARKSTTPQHWQQTLPVSLILCTSFIVVILLVQIKCAATYLSSSDYLAILTTKTSVEQIDSPQNQTILNFIVYDNAGSGTATKREILNISDIFKFPSIQERVKYYMGSWFHNVSLRESLQDKMPCPRYYTENVGSPFHESLLFDRNNSNSTTTKKYGRDNIKYMFPNAPVDDMVLLQVFGDVSRHEKQPLIHKARFACLSPDWRVAHYFGDELEKTKYQDEVALLEAAEYTGYPIPLIALLAVDRHFGKLPQVKRHDVVSWKQKNDVVFWRGSWTGRHRKEIVTRFVNYNVSDIDVGFMRSDDRKPEKNKQLEKDGLLRDAVSREDQLRFKYFLSIEGNDVASGLKWMLLANSVVFMSPPTRTSWAMEELLVPYYHYIPIMTNGEDLPQKLEWARDHDDDCKAISRQSTEYMMKLYAGKNAETVNKHILRRMLSSYHQQYGPWLAECRERDLGYQRTIGIPKFTFGLNKSDS